MAQPPHNHNVGVGGHRSSASLSTSQQPQSLHNPTSSGERSSGTARSIQPCPLTSAGGPSESQTPDQCSPALSGATEWEQSHPPTLLSSPPEQTIADWDFDVYSFVQAMMDPGGPEAATCFFHASEQPPITPESLAELDMPRIINNPKLRHDVNFDRELSFRPNLDGSKGRQKMRLAEEYWKALEAELFLYNYVLNNVQDPQQQENEAYWQGILAHSQKRLASLFHAIRDILKTLVPDCDQKTIEDRLDVELIMRQILNGMFDVIDLGNWLAKIIKNHCAPMRDVEVDAMQAAIKRSVEDERPFRLVNGIRQLLTLLENMKLDVANHQIRHMRPLLVEDTVNFQRRYNAHRISMGKIDVPRSRLWLEREIESMSGTGTTPTHLEALTSALFRGLVSSDHFNSSSAYPPTFYLDIERLRLFRNDLHSRIYQEICKEVLLEVLPKHASPAQVAEAVATLHHCVDTILSGCHGRLGANVEYVAAEIMRLVLVIEQKEGQCDSDMLDDAQQRLERDLRTQSRTFKKHALDLVNSLLPRLQASVAKRAKCPALRLQDLLVPPAPPNITHSLPLGYAAPGYGAICDHPTALPIVDPDEEVIRRFTHVLVLHWHVWAELVYLAPSSYTENSDDDTVPTPPSSRTSSPTVPVAQAVYEPGKKWLPVGLTVTDVPSGLPTPAPSPSAEASGHSQSSDTDDDSDRPCHSGASSNAEHSS